jgi:hypothetical protein
VTPRIAFLLWTVVGAAYGLAVVVVLGSVVLFSLTQRTAKVVT